jgi:hypothetical protein
MINQLTAILFQSFYFFSVIESKSTILTYLFYNFKYKVIVYIFRHYCVLIIKSFNQCH